MRRCRSRSRCRATSGSPPARTSTLRASGCRRAPPGTRCRRRSTTGARAGRAGSTGARRPRRRARRSHGWSASTPPSVAVGATVSGLVGLVAASLPDGSRVLAPGRRVHLDALPVPRPGAPRRHGAARCRPPSSPRRSTRRPTSSPSAPSRWRPARSPTSHAIAAAARAHGALTARRRDPGLRVAASRRLDASTSSSRPATSGCSRRAARRTWRSLETGSPTSCRAAAGWYAGEDVHASYFGPPLRLAADARRLDTSPAWHCWVGAAPALALIEEIGVAAIHDARPPARQPLPGRPRPGAGDSAIVFVDVPDAEERLERAGIRAARAQRTPAHVVARLQHRRGRRPDAGERLARSRRSLGTRTARRAARPTVASLTRGRPCSSPRALLDGVDRLPARVGDGRRRRARRGRRRHRRRAAGGSSPAAASSSSSSTVSVASFLFVPITPLGPRLIQPVQ